MNDDFYIGWQAKAAPAIAAHVRNMVVLILILTAVTAIALTLAQHTIGVAVFEWGTTKTFSGILKAQPYPHLIVPRPGHAEDGFSTYYLVAPFKFGLKPQAIASLDGKQVTLKGTLIFRGNQTMIETRPDSIRPNEHSDTNSISTSLPQPLILGRQTLVGEIVDSKCYLGVMNPGQLTSHRACAVRCISGGIPPVLLVRQQTGPPLYFLLVSSDGRPVNRQVLDMVAQPVQITGEVVRQGDLLVLRSDPKTYHRL
jgi:hypothetical protein